jgi:hypothetical protein
MLGEPPAEALSPEALALRQACAAGDAGACCRLGRLYVLARGVPKDEGLAEGYLSKACDGGYADACADLGELFVHRGEISSMQRAARLFRVACEGGSLKGCARLGRSQVLGLGIPPDVAGGSRLLQATCERGEPEGCVNLGGFYMTEGGKKDPAKAVHWFEDAVRRGGGHASLAIMHWKGIGVARNPQRARVLFEQGCWLDDAESCANLGIMYQVGEGGPPDHAAAVASFERACSLGSPRGCAARGE